MIVPRISHRTIQKLGSPRKLVILGSTGSIGRSTLDVVRAHPDLFKVFGIVAAQNRELIQAQAEEFSPSFVGLVQAKAFSALVENPPNNYQGDFLSTQEEVSQLLAHPEVDMVVAAVMGMAGLQSTIAALRAGKVVALANKESLIAGAPFVKEALENGSGALIPVDSEHSALFQALQGESEKTIRRLILTASGGPFRETPASKLENVSVQEALAHPRWSMGQKISVDSATMMNKALELIEAHYLYDIAPESIEVLIHPGSYVHSLVEFCDGTQIAQISEPDMKGPIAYALSYGSERLPRVMDSLDLSKVGSLNFFELDNDRFPAVRLARKALENTPAGPFILNLANEVAVQAFLDGKIRFVDIVRFVEQALSQDYQIRYDSLEMLLEEEKKLRREFEELIGS